MTIPSDHDQHSDYEPGQLMLFSAAEFVLLVRVWTLATNALRSSSLNCMNVTAVFALKNVYG